MSENSWLQELKPGDEVIVSGNVDILTTVERVTRTQIVYNDLRFERDTGRQRGHVGRWSVRSRLKPVFWSVKDRWQQ